MEFVQTFFYPTHLVMSRFQAAEGLSNSRLLLVLMLFSHAPLRSKGRGFTTPSHDLVGIIYAECILLALLCGDDATASVLAGGSTVLADSRWERLLRVQRRYCMQTHLSSTSSHTDLYSFLIAEDVYLCVSFPSTVEVGHNTSVEIYTK